MLIDALIRLKRWFWDERQYNKIMENPFDYFFLIPAKDKFEIDYYEQKDRRQLLDKLALPANSEHTIVLKIVPKIDLEVRVGEFGFEGDGKQPVIVDYDNPFVLEPHIKPEWYRDWHKRYHITFRDFWEKGDAIILGFRVATHERGKYNLNFHLNVKSDKFKMLNKTKVAIVKTNMEVAVV
ncbi:MAG: hypothetical protein PHU95_06400 [Candidatus Thermoplasmatota archaeon]|nr:hypothetical protein [Candidatus Thermoplasmatota archaeon]